ncbi:MAG: ribosome maturation factor RimP [Cyclobacteriaceae bacterium]
MQIEKKIHELIEEIISDQPDLFIVDVQLKGSKANQRLQIFMDGDKGIQIDQSAHISRKLGHQIEELGLIEDKYILEVSSAGMGVPLKSMRQYKKNEGRQLEVRLKNGESQVGNLLGATDAALKLEIEENEVEIPFGEIEKSTVVVSFK